jgi:HAMP domain-containing protein
MMRKTGDQRGALKIYTYILDEVDVDEKVVEKPLLYFTIAALHAELGQLQPATAALEKYKQHIATRNDADLPQGQRRAEVEQLAQNLRAMAGRLRIGNGMPGVHVLVDGRDVGVTPLNAALPLAPGPHRVEFSGAPLSSQEVEIPSGSEIVLLPPNLTPTSPRGSLGRATEDSSEQKPRPVWRLVAGSIGIALGAGLIAGSISPLLADGKCAGGAAPPCPPEVNAQGLPVTRVIDGRSVGGPLLGVGIVAAVAGTVLIAIPGKKRPLSASLAVTSGVQLNLATAF